MVKKRINGIDIYFFERLLKYKNLIHFVTTRSTTNNKFDFNLSLDRNHSKENWDKLKKALKIDDSILFLLKQIHSDKIVVLEEIKNQKLLPEADAVITRKKNIILSVLTADCVPILIYDPETNSLGVIHAGWRGSSKKITQKTLQKMKARFNINPEKTLAFIGPSIGPCCYEVNQDVATLFTNYSNSIIIKSEKTYLDLWHINTEQLISEGILEKNIEIARICTMCNRNQFFSARGDGSINTGRFASGLIIK